MRFSPALLCFSALFSAAAAGPTAPPSPTDTYISARNRYIAAFKANPTRGPTDKRQDRALADIERRLKAVILPWTAPGFPPEGKINFDTLEEDDIGYGMIDGLRYSDSNTDVVVTTKSLLRQWLVAHKLVVEEANVQLSIPAGLRSNAFWTQTTAGDAAAYLYGAVAVLRQKGMGDASAQLALFSNGDAGDAGPDELVATVMTGDRVFVAHQRLATFTVPVSICHIAYKRTLAISELAWNAYRASGQKDQKSFDAHVSLGDRAGRDYRVCFAQHLREQPNYAAIQKQAQALVDLLR